MSSVHDLYVFELTPFGVTFFKKYIAEWDEWMISASDKTKTAMQEDLENYKEKEVTCTLSEMMTHQARSFKTDINSLLFVNFKPKEENIIEEDSLAKAIAEYNRRTMRGDADMYVDVLKRFIDRETSYRNKQKEGGKT